MPIIVPWVLFIIPLIGAILAWMGLFLHWSAERHRFEKVLANIPATAAPLLACSALWYVQFVRAIPPFDHTVERWGLLLTLSGVVTGLIACRFRTWFSIVSLCVSAWMFILFFLMGLTS